MKALATLAVALPLAVAGPSDRHRDVATTLPVLQQLADMGVTYFGNHAKCRMLVDLSGSYADGPECFTYGRPAGIHRLDGAALKSWERWRATLANLPFVVGGAFTRRSSHDSLEEGYWEIGEELPSRLHLVYQREPYVPPAKPTRLRQPIDRHWFLRENF